MKKIKILLVLLIIILVTGCFKRDTLEDIDIVTTNYATEYITKMLYGEHSTITNIYPDGTDTYKFILTNKQISDNSKKDLIIYNGVTNDKELTYELISKNKKMLIIDSSYGIDINYGDAELWLNPSNLLMMSQNIKNGLKEYLTNAYLEKEIDKNYDKIKVILSEIEADLKLMAQNAKYKTIVVNSDTLKFLEKYGLTVISLDTSKNVITEKQLNEINNLITSGKIKGIFALENVTNSEEFDSYVNNKDLKVVTLKRLDSITDQDRENKLDYEEIMVKNIESLKSIIY